MAARKARFAEAVTETCFKSLEIIELSGPTQQVERKKNSSTRLNCWEFKGCGREPGGSKVAEFGVCPAATEAACDGINGGKNGGRYCWRVAGTFCEDEQQGTYAKKLMSCIYCDFLKAVQDELSKDFKI